MAAVLKEKFPLSPFRRENRVAFIVSLVFHGFLASMIFMAPHLGAHKMITVPRSYTVNLVSLPPELLKKLTIKPGATLAPALPSLKGKESTALKITPPAKIKAPEAIPLETTEKKAPPPPSPTVEAPSPPLTPPSLAKVHSGDYTAWSSVGAVAVDVETFAFTYYLGIVQNKISQNWVPPTGMAKTGRTERATVYFKILRNGQIKDLSIETSSGAFFFDQSALRAVSRSVPLPPLPVGFGEDALGIHFDFELRGEQG